MYHLASNILRQRSAALRGTIGSVRPKGVLASLKDSVETINKKTGEALAGGIEHAQDAARRLTGRAKASDPAKAAKGVADRAADAVKPTGAAGGQRGSNESGVGSGTAGRKAS